jgi:predicted lipid-binding transport protein (Tim44 family)
MTDFLFNPSNLILLAIAVVIFIRLRSVLGRRTGQERPPFDPYARRDERARAEAGDNVVSLPRSTSAPVGRSTQEIDRVAPQGSALNEALRAILSVDRSFEPDSFLGGAKIAYEAIVTAFAQGDRETLRQLLAPEVYDGFVAAITEREERGEKVESTFVGLDAAEIIEASMRGGLAQVTVRFVSQLITVTRGKDGEIVDGDPSRVVEVTDIWTFAREVAARDPNWRLIATAAGS